MIRFFFSLFSCQHPEMTRDTIDGVKVYRCECGHVEPQISRKEPLKFEAKRPAHERYHVQRRHRDR